MGPLRMTLLLQNNTVHIWMPYFLPLVQNNVKTHIIAPCVL